MLLFNYFPNHCRLRIKWQNWKKNMPHIWSRAADVPVCVHLRKPCALSQPISERSGLFVDYVLKIKAP